MGPQLIEWKLLQIPHALFFHLAFQPVSLISFNTTHEFESFTFFWLRETSGCPSLPGTWLVSFSRTFSLLSTKNLFFPRPRPACSKICFQFKRAPYKLVGLLGNTLNDPCASGWLFPFTLSLYCLSPGGYETISFFRQVFALWKSWNSRN